jgi:GMP synthase (glutamine-hydrolysing)
MSDTVLMILQMSQARDDRVAHWFRQQGYALDRRFVATGDPLPSTDADYAALVVYGGPQSANDGPEKPYIADELAFIRDWTRREKPMLGLCLGAQLLARAHDATVARHAEGLHEIGYYPVAPTAAGREIMPEPMHVYHWHNEGFEVPANGELLVTGESFPNQAFRIGRHAYGLQFHPETTVPIFTTWMAEAGHMLAMPGARPREAHFRDALAHDDRLAAWLEGFLPAWLDAARP